MWNSFSWIWGLLYSANHLKSDLSLHLPEAIIFFQLLQKNISASSSLVLKHNYLHWKSWFSETGFSSHADSGHGEEFSSNYFIICRTYSNKFVILTCKCILKIYGKKIKSVLTLSAANFLLIPSILYIQLKKSCYYSLTKCNVNLFFFSHTLDVVSISTIRISIFYSL